jgi:hypothetical protein
MSIKPRCTLNSSFIINDIRKLLNYKNNEGTDIEIPFNSYINKLNMLSDKDIYLLIDEIINDIGWHSPTYKYNNHYKIFEFLTNVILYLEKKYTSVNLSLNFLTKISIFNNGHKLLNMIKHIIYDNINKDIIKTNYIIHNILYTVCCKGTLPIFLFWKNFINNENISNIYNDTYNILLYNSCINNDNRIFKYLLNTEKIINKNVILKKNITEILLHIFDDKNNNKMKMKMIKELNNYINLDIYFETMMSYLNYSIKSFKILSKYYYKHEISFNFLYNILKIAFENDNYIYIYKYIYNELKYPNEKYYYVIIKNLFFNNINKDEIKIIDNINFPKILNYNKTLIISEIITWTFKEISTNNLISYIIKYYSNNTSYLNEYISSHLVKIYQIIDKFWNYTKFITIKSEYNNSLKNKLIRYNYILHKLRCIAKKKKNTRNSEKKFNMLPILNEITNFTPNKKIVILTKGSINYQRDKQKFTKLPPRHILPFEINYLEDCLIKEKSDGINVDKLPNNIYPNSKIIDYDIKAEYIEELDLYLIYDINLPDMDIFERQTYLRNEHLYTNKLNNLQCINTFDELLCCIENEREHIKSFLSNNDNNDNNIKWYPKASFKINKFNDKLILDINNYIEEINPKINLYINEGLVKNDGFIITPLNGNQEIKIKPKSLLTIDLLFKNNSWIDSNYIKYSNIRCTKSFKENKIYRCYPILNKEIFEPREIRYDKKFPNTNKICNLLQSLINFNWLKNYKENNNYYQKNIKYNNNYINKILLDNKNIFINHIKLINPEQNKNWLDLGCGKCKFFNDLKIYNPKKYFGIDIDVKNTIITHNKFNEYKIFEIYNCDLSTNWTDSEYKITKLDYDIKYDYIFCNFSLMHFSTDLFWSQLDKITIPGSIFMFNLTIKNSLWLYNNSYLKSDENTTEIYFEWIHNNPIKEKLISSSEIINIIEKYNWKLSDIIHYSDNNLIKCYEWYIITKN